MEFADQIHREGLADIIGEALEKLDTGDSSEQPLLDFLRGFRALLRGVLKDASPIRKGRERAMAALKGTLKQSELAALVKTLGDELDVFDPLAHRRPETAVEVQSYVGELDGLARKSLEFARAKGLQDPMRGKAFGSLLEECKEVQEGHDLAEFPFKGAYLTYPPKLRAQRAKDSAKLPEDMAPFLAFFAEYNPDTWTDFPSHAVDMDRILGGLTLYLAGLSDPRMLPVERGHNVSTKYLNEFIGFFSYLNFSAQTSQVKGLALSSAFKSKSFRGTADTWNAPKGAKDITLHVDAELFYYHLMQGANIAMGNPGRNPLSHSARASTHRDFVKFISRQQFGREVVMSEVLRAFKALFHDADAVLGDVEVEKKEGVIEMDERTFSAWVKRQFVPQVKQRILDEQLRAKAAEIGVLEKTCHTEASVVPGEVSGRISLNGRTRAASIKELTIARRNPERIVYPSNLACEGAFIVDIKGKPFRLSWELHGDGGLVFRLGEKMVGAAQLNTSDGKNCYLETKRLILLGLQDILKKEGARLDEALPDGTKQNPLPIPGLAGKPVLVQPRVSHMLRTWTQSRGIGNPIAPRGIRTAMRALDKLSTEGRLSEADIDGLDLYVQQAFMNPQGAQDWIYVMGDTVTLLRALALKELSEETVFLCQRPGEVVRAGYQPWEDPRDASRLNCTQKESTSDSEARRVEVERLFRVELTRSVEQMTTVRVPSHIDRVTLGSKDELDSGDAWSVSRDELSRFAQGEREGLSERILRVEAVPGGEVEEGRDEARQRLLAVLQVPQNVVFNQGTFISLSEARSL